MSAGIDSFSYPYVIVVGDDADNRITVSTVGRGFVVHDETGATPRYSGCRQGVDAQTVECGPFPASMTLRSPTPIYSSVVGGNGDDTVQTDVAGLSNVSGGPGEDTLVATGTTRWDEGTNMYGGPGVDSLTGGPGRDYLSGGPEGDSLVGGEGHDRLVPGDARTTQDSPAGSDGRDTVDGGTGSDLVDYRYRASGIDVDLERLDGHGEPGENDRLVGVEGVRGGSGADRLAGNDAANHLDGDRGADTLIGRSGNDSLWLGEGLDDATGGDGDDRIGVWSGNDGRDLMDGGAGRDLVDYGTRYTPVDLDLRRIDGQGSAGENDRLVGFESIVGSSGSDTLHGTDADNEISGGSGEDSVLGAGGQDVLAGNEDADSLDGGTGDDSIKAQDRKADTVRCGEGTDQAAVDDIDDRDGCETEDVLVTAEDNQPPPDKEPVGPPPTGEEERPRARLALRGRCRLGSRRLRCRLRGSVTVSPSGLSAARRCAGRLRLSARSRGRSLATRQLRLRGRCRYRLDVSILRRRLTGRRITLTARLTGNPAVRARSARVVRRLRF